MDTSIWRIFRASSLVFNFTEKGNGIVYIDDINFKSKQECVVGYSEQNKRSPHERRKLIRAMWVWHSERLLLETDYRQDFFEFCHQYGVNEIFLQLLYYFENELTDEVKCIIRHPAELRNFIKSSRDKGILIHALDGYPDFALRKYHPQVLAQVQALIDFNRKSTDEEKFFGIHLDNEPYLLLGFEGPSSETILLQFLDLNRAVMDILAENTSGMVYGIDIPFWFDEAKDAKGQLKYSVTYNGQTKNVAHHLIDIVDNVGIMDYRNFAQGLDGIINHGHGEIDYANAIGKRIYLGVETFKDEPINVSFIYSKTNKPINITSRFNDFRIRVINASEGKWIGLAQPKNQQNQLEFDAALVELFQSYGLTSDAGFLDKNKLIAEAKSKLGANPEYKGLTPFHLKDSDNKVLAWGVNTTEYMLDKTTFAGKTKSEMEDVLSEVGDAFIDKKAFIGFAIPLLSNL